MLSCDDDEAADQLRAALRPEHLEFLGLLKTSLTVGRFFFAMPEFDLEYD